MAVIGSSSPRLMRRDKALAEVLSVTQGKKDLGHGPGHTMIYISQAH